MSTPLRISFEVACPAEHAFQTWTSRISTWWPADHSVSGQRDLTVVLEDGVGGRIYERTADGVEHDWGVVTVWEPPARLGYSWHLGQDSSAATDVEIRFESVGSQTTRVQIEHTGWERLGREKQAWRDRNRAGWGTLLPHFTAAIAKGAQ